MDNPSLSEADIRTRHILPAIHKAGWSQEQIREEYTLSRGRINVRGGRDEGKRADYVLFCGEIPLAVVEAKNDRHNVEDGIQQALTYADRLQVPFIFSSNGESFVFHDKTALGYVEKNLKMDKFPSPETLWQKWREWKNLSAESEKIISQGYHETSGGKSPHYYQRTAINEVIHKVAAGEKRILLVMATGTGKTYTAFQIIWRLWKAGAKKRILFLADRDALIRQTRTNDFRPFGPAMTRLSGKDGTLNRASGEVDASREIYLALYQSLTGPQESDKIFRKFSPDFFDFIVVDECHRGSANEDSAWREILEYFSGAAQLGMTATPKETKYASNIHYFGKPVYTYSLKQGIADGYLAPYKVIKVHIDRNIEGYTPSPGQTDREGNKIEQRHYSPQEIDKDIVIDKRTELAAKRISDYLRDSGDRFQKTIVFCVDSEHAARMRQALINENSDICAENSKYIMRIVAVDKEGVAQLDNFRSPEKTYPVIATTARLLSTGIDIPTCRLIVLDREVGSMSEFKQILGRGTRLHKDSGKRFFTLIDFRNTTVHFSDPQFDGNPVQVYEPREDESMVPPDDEISPLPPDGEPVFPPPEGTPGIPPDGLPPGGEVTHDPKKRNKIYIDGEARIIGETIQYMGAGGNLITENLRLYSRNRVLEKYATLSDFLTKWTKSEQRAAVLEELADAGLLLKDLSEKIGDEIGGDLDPFDLVCHVAFGRPPKTRNQRALQARKSDIYTRQSGQAREVLEALLTKYEDGVQPADEVGMLSVLPISQLGTVKEITDMFGGAEEYRDAVRKLYDTLYQDAA